MFEYVLIGVLVIVALAIIGWFERNILRGKWLEDEEEEGMSELSEYLKAKEVLRAKTCRGPHYGGPCPYAFNTDVCPWGCTNDFPNLNKKEE